MRESNELFRTAFERAASGIAIVAPDGRFLKVNQRYCDIVGYPHEDILNTTFRAITHPEDLGADENYVKRLLAGEIDTYSMEKRYVRNDGSQVWVNMTVSLVRGPGGKPKYMVGVVEDITGRKRAEEALRQSEERFKLFITNSPVPIAIYDYNEDVEYVNDKFVEAFGYTIEDVPNVKCWWPLAYPDREYRQKIFDLWNANIKHSIINGMGTEPVENVVTCKDGSTRVMVALGMPIADKIMVIFNDITERKRAENALKANEAFLNDVLNCIQDGISILDSELNVIRVNHVIEDWHPYMMPIVGKKCYSVYHNRSEPCENCPSVKALKEKKMQKAVVPFSGEKGQRGWLEIYAFPMIDKEGTVTGIVEHVRDITESKRAEEALRESEEKFRVLADTTSAMIVLHQGQNFLYANKVSESITGYSNDELLQMNFWDVFHPDSRDLVKARGMARVRGEDVTNYETRILTKNGTVKWVYLTAGRIMYMGKPSVIMTLVDITKRKAAEVALEEAKNQAEIYLDLMGHDISNLNQVGMGYMELALDTLDLDDRGKEMLSKTLEALESSSKLIDKVRKIQQVKDGNLKLHAIDVARMLRELSPRYSNIIGREVAINYVSGCHCFVKANDLLTDVFSNILGNAVKHSSGPLIINIRVSKVQADDKAYCKVVIEDDGPGIPDDVKKKLFSRFQRGQTRASGKGLGLYLIRSLMKYYQGHVWVEDREPGDYTKGTRFVVMLPAIDESLSYDEYGKTTF